MFHLITYTVYESKRPCGKLRPAMSLLWMAAFPVTRNFSMLCMIISRWGYYQDIRCNHLRTWLLEYLQKALHNLFAISHRKLLNKIDFGISKSMEYREICPGTQKQSPLAIFHRKKSVSIPINANTSTVRVTKVIQK